MNTTSPLVPQGSLPPKGKSTIKIAFFTIVAIHVVVIGGMLMQGCSKDKQSATAPKADEAPIAANPTDVAPQVDPAITPATGNITPTTAATAITTPTPTALPTAQPLTAVQPPAPVAPVAPAADAKEYTIAKGDTLGGIAKKNHVSLKALQDANPTVDAKKLQIDQKIQIPASTASVTASTGSAVAPAAADATASDSSSYKVKSGDALERIAKSHGTSVKAIMALNGLKSANRLREGQVLKMPAPKAAATAPAEAPAHASVVSAPTATVASAAPAATGTANP